MQIIWKCAYAKSITEEIELKSPVPFRTLNMGDIVDILRAEYAIITGGKSKEGCSLITFPDHSNFHMLTDIEYQQLMLYLTSVPSLQEADLGFHLIVDRRKDRWNSVKTVLLKISVYFPGLIHVVYVIRPTSFLQKALSEVSNKLFKEEFKFRVIILSTLDELHEHVDINQLTSDLGGLLLYSHEEWIQQRIALEQFSLITQRVSHALDEFTKKINETEFPNNVDSTQQLLNQQTSIYSELKEEILTAAKHGEQLLTSIRENSGKKSDTNFHYPDTIANVFAVERLLVQLEETERTFDDFWQQHSTKLRHCLDLRRFEQDFRELQINFNSHLKTMSEMTEIGDSVTRIETLIRETATFQKLCTVDIERAEEVISSGERLLKIKNSFPHECIKPKCTELICIRHSLMEKLYTRMTMLTEYKLLLGKIERAKEWCIKGLAIVDEQQMEDLSCSAELAEQQILEIQDFLNLGDFKFDNSEDCKTLLQDFVPSEVKRIITQILERIADLTVACNKRIAALKLIVNSFSKPAPVISFDSNKSILRKANTISKIETVPDNSVSDNDQNSSPEIDVAQYEVRKAKRGHVLNELLETERIYVLELLSILKGYKMEALSEEMQPILPHGLLDKIDILFGNLDELYHFHGDIFLKDLENCISTTDLVALCFVQRRDMFYQLYSYYCQNIPRSEQLREALVDTNLFFQRCQHKLGHKLPLAAYLLKPVQRITKYQLLLKDLLRYSDEKKSCKELQQALDCMLVVLRCVNDSMHQISISGFPVDLSQQGDLLLQGSFSVWTENKKDLKLRLKPMRRHIFLYQKAVLFCKPTNKTTHNKSMYHFKHYLKMSQIGLTESVKGDIRKFELWLQGRQEVHTIQASTVEQKQMWVNEIKRVLLNQLEELKGEKIKQYTANAHKALRQVTSWEKQKIGIIPQLNHHRTMSCDTDSHLPTTNLDDDSIETIESGNWSSDCSNSDDEEHQNTAVVSGRYVALADYCAMGISEVNMKDGDIVELLKVGCAGWWFVKLVGTSIEGWAPAAYLENIHRKTSRSSSRSHDKLS
ncbi:guanine nucleotide exchange factor DBS-like isoform X1 [Photinus pyralis]|uniref:guanine nucleotide exchange factor DBS-like isoform X1 n=1 Tax=Photinus pyralis TaxID=7054 RepID=UPI0012677B5A|nr:guanine nucleotide exchange factor DBS-like isoform X1 [Photinus pyralis]